MYKYLTRVLEFSDNQTDEGAYHDHHTGGANPISRALLGATEKFLRWRGVGTGVGISIPQAEKMSATFTSKLARTLFTNVTQQPFWSTYISRACLQFSVHCVSEESRKKDAHSSAKVSVVGSILKAQKSPLSIPPSPVLGCPHSLFISAYCSRKDVQNA